MPTEINCAGVACYEPASAELLLGKIVAGFIGVVVHAIWLSARGSGRSESGDDRDQSEKVQLVIGLAIAMVVGILVIQGVVDDLEESEWAPEACEHQYGEGAKWINDSDDVVECRLPNGSVREAELRLRSNVSPSGPPQR